MRATRLLPYSVSDFAHVSLHALALRDVLRARLASLDPSQSSRLIHVVVLSGL